MLEWAGISFGKENTLRLQKSIKRLASMSGAEALRFGGKIFGTEQDYWIAIGRLPQAEEDSSDPAAEARGKGVNETVFWVTSNLLTDWIQLPDARPQHIKQARLIKHVFTGNLNADVNVNPAFDGKERHLLRATLARIFHATALVPKGLFALDEDTNEVKFSDEFALPKTDELRDIKAWSNVHPIILQAGRCSHIPPQGIAEDDLQAAIDDQEAKDPAVERFRDIGEHAQFPGEQPAWLSKVVGDTQLYTEGGEAGETISYAVNVLKSLRWPGAITVSKGGKHSSIYIGYGLKRGDPSYNPIEPPAVQADPEEELERPEPTPLTEPVAVADPVDGGDGDDD
jgi:radial spoke head protein 4A